MSKDLWFAEYERLRSEFEDDEGREPTDAEDMVLADKAHASLRDRLADMADDLKNREHRDVWKGIDK